MKRFKNLWRYQKGILIFMAVMLLVFTVAYLIITAREGFVYHEAVLVPKQENGNTVYSGKIQGKQASFTVYADGTVEFRYGEKFYGPYTAREDPSAIPKADSQGEPLGGESVTGVELRCKGELLFRGCVVDYGDIRRLYNEDGTPANLNIGIWATTGNGVVTDGNGNIIDQMEPSVSTILDLMAGPELSHKGAWSGWFVGVFLCILTAFSILFADELFRWNLALRIQNADRAEPSDWEIAGRYISWTLLPVIAMFVFIEGLRQLP